MDLSNVVFIEEKPKSRKSKGSNVKTKGISNKKSNGTNKVKMVSLKGRAVKYNKPMKKQNNVVKKAGRVVQKGIKTAKKNGPPKIIKADEKLLEDLSQHWNKVPPKDGEPKTKKHHGKIYHWCHYCKFWSFHKPGKGKKCQAVDPVAHLLNYFGGKNMSHESQPQSQSFQDDHQVELMDCDDLSL